MKNAILSYPPPCPPLRLPALLRSHDPRTWLSGRLDLLPALRKLRIPRRPSQAPLRLGEHPWWGALWARNGWDLRRIVKREVERGEARLLRELRAADAAHRSAAPVTLGGTVSGDDPYSRDRAPVTTALLEMLDRFEGLALSLTTRQPRVREDLDLLTHLDGKHVVTVTVPLESDAPTPNARLQTVQALAARGLAVRILVVASIPARTDTRRLERLFAAAAAAGARDVQTRWDPLPTIFERLRLAYGFPQPVAGRG